MQESKKDSQVEQIVQALGLVFPGVPVKVTPTYCKLKIPNLSGGTLVNLLQALGSHYDTMMIKRSDSGLALIVNLKTPEDVAKKV